MQARIVEAKGFEAPVLLSKEKRLGVVAFLLQGGQFLTEPLLCVLCVSVVNR
jgi:hypothetical protein